MTVWIEAPFDSLPTEGFRKQRYWLMAEAFVRAGHGVVFWTSDFSHAAKAKRAAIFPQAAAQAGFELRMLPTRPYRRNVGLARAISHRAYAQTWEMAARSADLPRPSVIIVSAPPVATGAAARRLARQLGAKLVVDIQDAWPETFVRLLPRGLKWTGSLLFLPLRVAVRQLYREADLVTGVCDRYAALAAKAGARTYHRAYLGVELRTCRARTPGGSSIRLVYVGNTGVGYDLKTVMEGVRLLRQSGVDVSLDIAGFGEGATQGRYSTVDAAGVRFHGMLGADALSSLLENCDIGIVPMRAESFVGVPNKFGEYAAAGLKILSSLEGESAELLAQYGCGVTYRAGDARSFAAAVEQCAGCASSRPLAEREFDAGRIYADYVRRIEAL